MWNQKATAATSDNNKEKAPTTTTTTAADDCSCAADGVSVASTANPASVEQQPKVPATIENNSKQITATTTNTTSSFGGRSNESSSSEKKELAAQSETTDSGFISGPQSTQIFSEEIFEDNDEESSSDKGQQKPEQQQQQQLGKDKKPATATVSDSGFLTEEIEVSGEQQTEQEQEQETEMRLKYNVDKGTKQWTVQSSLASDEPINNLNSATTTANNPPSSNNTTTTGRNKNAAQTTTNVGLNNSNIMNAWEQFFQQNDDGDTPLHLACISGYMDVVEALIRMAPHPCLLNIQNDVAQTPLHLAALTAQPTILRRLLLAGAEPTVRDRHGNTALHLSTIAGEKQCVRALTEKFGASEIQEAHRHYGYLSNDKAVSSLSYARLPADLEMRNYDGERCVHLAAEGGHIDILRILVSHGADINAREGKGGRTPLHIAIEYCNEDLANFLLDECEKLNLETATYAGLTAYQVASVLNKSRMQNILKNRGAETLTPPDSDCDSSDIEDLDDTKMYDRFGDPRYFVSYSGCNPMTVA
ncbi:NF-kappa-B inhibitor cactus isoform X1 [Drosophila nasuta]|uniref:NF-kappa-B inhibitor cactus isoform X1 n=1 Tax=Drosophila nasuta TaxID=42062 RepID=UPI00295E63B8|nr:NF-kappa-B inhibitor cactus isoform X1 [Drosophila nasuta]XP_060644758.1 NF-kappa-B inhibitor cactus isoform X1 [Drosophila nasuta]